MQGLVPFYQEMPDCHVHILQEILQCRLVYCLNGAALRGGNYLVCGHDLYAGKGCGVRRLRRAKDFDAPNSIKYNDFDGIDGIPTLAHTLVPLPSPPSHRLCISIGPTKKMESGSPMDPKDQLFDVLSCLMQTGPGIGTNTRSGSQGATGVFREQV